MPAAKETWIEMGDELIHKGGEGIKECPRGVQGGNYPCILIQPIFLNYIIFWGRLLLFV
jgi:hypothetical protein